MAKTVDNLLHDIANNKKNVYEQLQASTSSQNLGCKFLQWMQRKVFSSVKLECLNGRPSGYPITLQNECPMVEGPGCTLPTTLVQCAVTRNNGSQWLMAYSCRMVCQTQHMIVAVTCLGPLQSQPSSGIQIHPKLPSLLFKECKAISLGWSGLGHSDGRYRNLIPLLARNRVLNAGWLYPYEAPNMASLEDYATV